MYLGRIGQSRTIVSATAVAATVETEQDEPYVAAVFELPCAFLSNGGHSVLDELRVMETVQDVADVRQPALRAHIFNRIPTTPTAGTAYVPQMDRHVGTILIEGGAATAAEPYRKWRRVAPKVRQAHVRAQHDVTAYSDDSKLWVVLVADATYTPATATDITVHAVIRRHT